MAKTLSSASDEYVKLVAEAVAETGLNKQGVDFQVYNLLKAKGNVIKLQKANEIAELLSNREDLVVIAIYEKAFDKWDDKTKRLVIESYLSQVSYDSEKSRVNIGQEPTITITLGFYHKYDKLAVDTAELEQITLQQIRDEEEEEKKRKKAERAAQRSLNRRRKF